MVFAFILLAAFATAGILSFQMDPESYRMPLWLAGSYCLIAYSAACVLLPKSMDFFAQRDHGYKVLVEPMRLSGDRIEYYVTVYHPYKPKDDKFETRGSVAVFVTDNIEHANEQCEEWKAFFQCKNVYDEDYNHG